MHLGRRNVPWPPPFDETNHRLHKGDARDLSFIENQSVHLVVTSPPYWTLKAYEPHHDQLGAIADYERFLAELDKVWRECVRVLAPGGRICCVVGDICVPRKRNGRHYVMPLHADIQVRTRQLGFDCLTPILWQKIANGATEAQGNGAVSMENLTSLAPSLRTMWNTFSSCGKAENTALLHLFNAPFPC